MVVVVDVDVKVEMKAVEIVEVVVGEEIEI